MLHYDKKQQQLIKMYCMYVINIPLKLDIVFLPLSGGYQVYVILIITAT